MGRTPRRDFEYAFHHVMNRAGARRWAFFGADHRNAFLEQAVSMELNLIHFHNVLHMSGQVIKHIWAALHALRG